MARRTQELRRWTGSAPREASLRRHRYNCFNSKGRLPEPAAAHQSLYLPVAGHVEVLVPYFAVMSDIGTDIDNVAIDLDNVRKCRAHQIRSFLTFWKAISICSRASLPILPDLSMPSCPAK